MSKTKKILFFIILFIAYSFSVVFLSYRKGYKNAIIETEVQVQLAKDVLKYHSNEIEKIYSETDSAAIARFRENFGTE